MPSVKYGRFTVKQHTPTKSHSRSKSPRRSKSASRSKSIRRSRSNSRPKPTNNDNATINSLLKANPKSTYNLLLKINKFKRLDHPEFNNIKGTRKPVYPKALPFESLKFLIFLLKKLLTTILKNENTPVLRDLIMTDISKIIVNNKNIYKISNKDKFNEHLQGLNLPEYKDDKDLEWYSNTYYK